MADFAQGIDWAGIRSGLRSLIGDLAGDSGPAWSPSMAEHKQPFIDPSTGQNVVLRLKSCQDIGEDEWRYTFDDVGNTLTTRVVGMRRIVLEVRCESYEDEDDQFAFITAERIRTRMFRPSSLVVLDALNMAIEDYTQITNVSVPQDDHMLSVGVFDLQMSAGFDDVDAPDPSGWIETVRLTSHVQKTPGVDLPAPVLNVTNVLIPPGI